MRIIKKSACLLIALILVAALIPLSAPPSSAAAVKIYGIDVSKWQGTNVDWAKVKASGVKFVILRIGTTYGKDSTFESNYTKAKAQGLDVGVYFYNYSKTKATIEQDAASVVSWLAGRQLEYPVYFDLEDNSLLSGYTNTDRTNFCIWFNTVIENAGYYAGVYTGYYWMNNYVNISTLRAKYPIWMARYLNSGTDSQDYSNLCGMWQYSSKGAVNGISGNVDMNVCYTDYPAYVKSHGLNHYSTAAPLTGYFTVNATALNVRSGGSTDYGVVATIQNGTEVAVTGYNADASWASVRYPGGAGWCKASYLTYRKAFPSIKVRYDGGGLQTTLPAGADCQIFTNYTLSAQRPEVGGYNFLGWNVMRTSDGKWRASSGEWTASVPQSPALYAPSSVFALDETNVNSDAQTETFVFSASWEYVAPISMAYYTVTTNTSPLMVRSADNTNGTVLARAPKGSEVAVIGFNADCSWARVIFEDTVGWSSMTYLTFKEDFGDMSVVYDMNGVPDVFCQGSVQKPFDTFEVGGEGITAEGYEFLYWTVSRASDGKTLTSDGGWALSPAAENAAHFLPGDSATLSYKHLNREVSSDTYTFCAHWQALLPDVLLGDVNGDGKVNSKDVSLFKRVLAFQESETEIVRANADTNGDGKLNSKDLSQLKRLLAG